MYLSRDETDALNNNLDTNSIRWWGNNVEKVLAWMPLPEAFKGVTE